VFRIRRWIVMIIPWQRLSGVFVRFCAASLGANLKLKVPRGHCRDLRRSSGLAPLKGWKSIYLDISTSNQVLHYWLVVLFWIRKGSWILRPPSITLSPPPLLLFFWVYLGRWVVVEIEYRSTQMDHLLNISHLEAWVYKGSETMAQFEIITVLRGSKIRLRFQSAYFFYFFTTRYLTSPLDFPG
jgi:hypothetical protein